MADNENTTESASEKDKTAKIDHRLLEDVLDAIRPSFQADGGDIELIGVDDETGVVTIEMTGACAGCSLSEVTISQGIERVFKDNVPGVTGVRAVM